MPGSLSVRKKNARKQQDKSLTPVEKQVQKLFGVNPKLVRNRGVAPVALNPTTNRAEWALPQVLYDMASDFVTPGLAAAGQPIGDPEAAASRFALNFTGTGGVASRMGRGAVGEGRAVLGMSGTPKTAKQASRLERARAQGFNTEVPLYHGTSSDFGVFSPDREIFLSDRPDVANIYAAERGRDKARKYGPTINADPNVRPVFAKMQNPLVVSDLGPDGSHGWSTDNMAAALGIDATSGPKLRGRALHDEARRQGYDVVKIENMYDLGGEQSQYIPLHPDYVKSQFDLFETTTPTEQGALSAVERAANLRAANPLLDESGNPLVVYHGTQGDISAFDPAKIQSRFPYSFGFHTSDNPREASGYADSVQNMVVNFNPKSPYKREVEEGANVMPLHVFPQNPLVIDTPNISASSEADLNRYDIMRRIVESRKTDNPYDSVIIRRKRGDEHDHMNVIMLDPNRIKSAIGNRGTFDLSDPDLNKARGGLAVKR